MKNRLLFNFVILFIIAALQAMIIFLPAFTYQAYFDIIRPAVYVLIFATTALVIGLNFGFKKNKKMAFLVMMLGFVLYIGMMFAAGVSNGFGRNPMTPSFGVVLQNMWRFLPFVILGEVIRWQIMRNTPKRQKVLVMWLVVLVFSFAMLDDMHRILQANTFVQVDYILTTVLPVLVLNFFLTHAATSDSLLGIILFRSMYSLIPIFMPILPNVSKLFIAILVYAVVFVSFILYDKYNYEEKYKGVAKTKPYRLWQYLIPGLVLVVCLSFGFGLFPVTPVAVASNSMQGVFSRGDMVFVQKLDADKVADTVKLGDIIQFNSDGRPIVHRVVNVLTGTGDAVTGYVTQGDNNRSPDVIAVPPNKVIGIVKFSIPLLGFPSVLLSELSR